MNASNESNRSYPIASPTTVRVRHRMERELPVIVSTVMAVVWAGLNELFPIF